MTDKIQKAREALTWASSDNWRIHPNDGESLTAALDEAEANAKRVAELEAAHSGQSHSASMCAAKSAKQDARIAELEQELEESIGETLQGLDYNYRLEAQLATEDAEIERLREVATRAAADLRHGLAYPTSAGIISDVVVRLERATTPGAALAPPEAKPAAPEKCDTFAPGSNFHFCAKCGGSYLYHVQSNPVHNPKPAEPAQCGLDIGETVCLRPCCVPKPPPAPEAAPDEPRRTAKIRPAWMFIETSKLDDLRAQLAAAQARCKELEAAQASASEAMGNGVDQARWPPGVHVIDALIAERDAAQAHAKKMEESARVHGEVERNALKRMEAANARADKAERERDEEQRMRREWEQERDAAHRELAECGAAPECIRWRNHAERARRDLAEAVELLRECFEAVPLPDDLEVDTRAFLARLSAVKGDES